MCYNLNQICRLNCKITLYGEEKRITEGYLERQNGGFRLEYPFDGDKVNLSCVDGKVLYSRYGSLRLDMRFTEGENTSCVLYEGATTGEIPVYTSLLRVVPRSDGWELLLKYTVGGVPAKLRLTAVTEKKDEN